jgi:hypothetical protein
MLPSFPDPKYTHGHPTDASHVHIWPICIVRPIKLPIKRLWRRVSQPPWGGLARRASVFCAVLGPVLFASDSRIGLFVHVTFFWCADLGFWGDRGSAWGLLGGALSCVLWLPLGVGGRASQLSAGCCVVGGVLAQAIGPRVLVGRSGFPGVRAWSGPSGLGYVRRYNGFAHSDCKMCDSTLVVYTQIAKCATVQRFCTLGLQNVRQYNVFAHSDCKMCDSTMVLHTRIAKCATVQWFCTLTLQHV